MTNPGIEKFVFADHSGQGGNWWTNVVLGTAVARAGGTVCFLTAPNYERILPSELHARLYAAMGWDTSSFATTQLSYFRNEMRALRAVPRHGALLLSHVHFGIAKSSRLIHYVHNPEAREMLGSAAIGRAIQWWSVQQSRITAQHGSAFGRIGSQLYWPHPAAPACLCGRASEAQFARPRGRRAALVFGRAASDDCLERVRLWVGELTAPERRRLHLRVSRTGISARARATLEQISRVGLTLEVVPRLSSHDLDGAVRAADVVLIPYYSHGSSVSGVGLIARANGVPVVVGPSVSPDLSWPPLNVIGTATSGLRLLLGSNSVRDELISIDALLPWGERWLSLVRSR